MLHESDNEDTSPRRVGVYIFGPLAGVFSHLPELKPELPCPKNKKSSSFGSLFTGLTALFGGECIPDSVIREMNENEE